MFCKCVYYFKYLLCLCLFIWSMFVKNVCVNFKYIVLILYFGNVNFYGKLWIEDEI